ncbi:MAG TPA: substrate-binding domain-containing protein [Gaiellaceae bacterium]|nr:substrate-binding domain-containing protein [Gaiellaceae bacterium]
MHGLRRTTVALLAALALVAALAAGAQARPEGGERAASHTIRVGVIYSRTGLLSAYGAQYVQGLRLGLQYATRGTGKVNGHRIDFTLVDDAGDPAKAVTAAKDLIGQGYKIIVGTVSSGVALQLAPLAEQNKILYISGPAATDAITGINRYTFRSGRQTFQDVKAATAFLRGAVGKNVVVFAQDSAFGVGNYAAVNTVFGNLGGQKVDRLLVPLSAQDFTPYARQLRQKNPDLVFVAWAGTTAGAMWNALDQQGVFDAVDTVVTGLAERATWPFYGPAAGKIKFLNHYNAQAPKNTVNDWLVATMKRRNQVPDLFTPDGFVAAQMIVRALSRSTTDVDRMIEALEGWSFTGPKGQQEIRASDHAMLQPMFLVQLRNQGGRWNAITTVRLRAKYTAPPQSR